MRLVSTFFWLILTPDHCNLSYLLIEPFSIISVIALYPVYLFVQELSG